VKRRVHMGKIIEAVSADLIVLKGFVISRDGMIVVRARCNVSKVSRRQCRACERLEVRDIQHLIGADDGRRFSPKQA